MLFPASIIIKVKVSNPKRVLNETTYMQLSLKIHLIIFRSGKHGSRNGPGFISQIASESISVYLNTKRFPGATHLQSSPQ